MTEEEVEIEVVRAIARDFSKITTGFSLEIICKALVMFICGIFEGTDDGDKDLEFAREYADLVKSNVLGYLSHKGWK